MNCNLQDGSSLQIISNEQLDYLCKKIVLETLREFVAFINEMPPQPKKTQSMMTLGEVMGFYRCSRSTVYTKIKNGELHPVKIGGKNLFKESEVKYYEQEYLKQ